MDAAAVKVIVFLILFIGGLVVDSAKKNKGKKRAEEIKRSKKAPVATSAQHAPAPNRKKAATPQKTVKTKSVRPEESEWLSTLADQQRRDAAKVAAKAAENQGTFEIGVSGAPIGKSPEPSASPFTLSVRQARNGFIMAEILGPPVSMR